MTTHAPGFGATRPSHTQLLWIVLSVAALAIVGAVIIVMSLSTNDNAQSTGPTTASTHHSSQTTLYDCRPTRVVHPC